MKNKQNVLDFVPVRKIENFSTDDSGVITLEIENKGVFNRIAQKLFKKPKITYIHLDEMGSFVWPLIDGEKDITEIGVFVSEHFGEKAEPLYPRLSKYFEILKSYGFVEFK
jgi:hypothetical protein